MPSLKRGTDGNIDDGAAAIGLIDRRTFLKWLGTSLAMTGVTACGRPPEDSLISRTRDEGGREEAVFYATTLCAAGEAVGVLVETHQGRPSKIEGNPLHPCSGGATGPLLQAAVLDLWDPDRSPAPRYQGNVATWTAFEDQVLTLLDRYRNDGRALRVASGPLLSPTLLAQRDALLARYPGSRWHVHDPLGEDTARQGSMLAFGAPFTSRYALEQADVVLSLEADLLDGSPAHLAYAAAFARRRRANAGATMSRWYAVEGTPSLTGAMADHRWILASSRIGDFLLELARALGVDVPADTASGIDPARMAALLDDLTSHQGRSLIAVGRSQPAHVHALAHLMNARLGNVDRTIRYRPSDALPVDFDALCDDMHAGRVETLILLDTNPMYAAPADLSFHDALRKVAHTVHAGLYRDETGMACQWHLPLSHALESWSDARSTDGTTSIVQPAIRPLYDTRSIHECVALLSGATEQRGRAIIRSQWSQLSDKAWESALREGVIQTERPESTAPAPSNDVAAYWTHATPSSPLELLFRPDALLHDGRCANNAWLQECPRPLTQLTWGNAAMVSPHLAAVHGLANGDLVRLGANGRTLTVPVWILPGQTDTCVTLHLGYGRTHAGRFGNGVGVNANVLRSHDTGWSCAAAIEPAAGHVELATTQSQDRMEEHQPVRTVRFDASHANTPREPNATPPSLYAEPAASDYAWGMTIDLNACIGCKGCTLACQAENNIPVVGPEEIRRGHHMHWMRVDRYHSGTPAAPRTFHQPVPCMHCEHAPCELVCPVGATVHDSDGLNVQVYNRCIGTRFCSNNCPYKVRRFNFLQYADLDTESLKGQRNPDVTVRNRGVMEKCTYCIQRIEQAHIAADRDSRPIRDGEVVTACQAACPTQAIHFGNLRDPGSDVSRTKRSPLHYVLLAELNTRPRTGYLARVENPHPSLDGEQA
ncbi:quinol:cytochrome c oxidoreductase iron-sulfur protein precursor [Dyella jiangningensis]|uniref:4Fe-4S dicluster domain-containing protein n=3 Tax=Gammaproteobacteria TaxID=1236 RepID=UPI00088DB4D9|nr:4Fe-4S dicluster domain-containing protein [Dyella sp. AtDHG13]PXV55852.1 quinol:cytochrome c oxidoreductase iron-sulfur protein precursor [Dyella sp. AtDHG13]SDK53876.1 quinol:cytochrome c oxidoreductase iron-sulfur protein precursor [Dyella jiangningensis]